MAKKKKKTKPKYKSEPKIGLYPGTFSPWHQGHTDIVNKSLKVFDKVLVAIGHNPEKGHPDPNWLPDAEIATRTINLMCKADPDRIEVVYFKGLLKDLANRKKVTAVIRGLRDGKDLDFEKVQQYWNEDLGMIAPTVYFVCDKSLVHISSTAIKMVRKLNTLG